MQKTSLIATVVIVLISVSCEEEIVTKEVDKTNKWNKHPSFQYDNSILLNSLGVDDSYMVISGTNFTSKVGNVAFADLLGVYDSIFQDYLLVQYNREVKAVNRKIPITSQISIDYSEVEPTAGQVNFVSTTNYGTFNSYLTDLNVAEVDPTFTGFVLDRSWWNDCFAINNTGQALIPYNSLSNDELRLRFLLVSTRQTGSIVYPTEILDSKIIEVEDKYQVRVNYLQSVNDVFFVATDSNTYRIDNEGNISRASLKTHAKSTIIG